MAQYDINLREYWRVVKKRKWVVVLITLLLALFSTFFAIIKTPSPLFSTVCLIEIQKGPVLEALYVKNQTWADSDDIETQMAVIKSYAVFQKVAEKMGLVPRQDTKGDRQLKSSNIVVIENLQSKIDVTREKFSSILHIKVTDSSPAFAQRLANTVALTYKDLHAEQQTQRITEALKYIEGQQKDLREKLRETEEEFNRFTKENELISIDLQTEKLLARAQEIQGELQKLGEDKTETHELLQRLEHFNENPSGSGFDFYSAKGNGRYQAVNETVVGLLLRKETLLKEFTPKHPDVSALSDEIVENVRKMTLILQQQIKGYEKRELHWRKEAESIESKTKVLLDRKLEYSRLKRKVELHTEMIALMERKSQEAMIRRAEKPETVNIVKPALLPTEAINPPRTMTNGLMGVLVGFVLSLVVAFIVETFDTSLGAIEEVEETLRTQVVGVVPQTDWAEVQGRLTERFPGGLKGHSQRHAINLISHYCVSSMMAESFRALRTNIEFRDVDRRSKTILVTSTSPQEGKTLVAANLAMMMAQSGKKTLLIGSDLRKPSIGRIFGVESTAGLTDVLLGNYHWRDTVKTVVDLVLGHMTFEEVMMTPRLDNLHLITSGSIPPDPTELIGSVRFAEFIQEAREEYQILILDTPPLLSAADAMIIGTKVDGVLLVYRIGAVSKGLLRRASRQLEQVRSHLIGVVLNGMRPDVSPDFDHFKQYRYYGSYAAEGEDRKKSEQGEDRGQKVFPELLWKTKLDNIRQGLGKEPYSVLRMILVLGAMGLLGLGILRNSGGLSFADRSESQTTYRASVKHEQGSSSAAPASTEGFAHVSKNEALASENAEPSHREEMTASLQASAASASSEGPAQVPKNESPPSEGPEPSHREETIASLQAKESTKHESGRYPFSVCLSSFPDHEVSKKATLQYRKKGLSPYIVKVQLNKGTWYRVYTGHFERREDADEYIAGRGLQGAKVIETPWANLIGIYSSPLECQERTKRLHDLGYFPYAVKDDDGKERLYLGAFNERERAQRMSEELTSKGIESWIVKR